MHAGQRDSLSHYVTVDLEAKRFIFEMIYKH